MSKSTTKAIAFDKLPEFQMFLENILPVEVPKALLSSHQKADISHNAMDIDSQSDISYVSSSDEEAWYEAQKAQLQDPALPWAAPGLGDHINDLANNPQANLSSSDKENVPPTANGQRLAAALSAIQALSDTQFRVIFATLIKDARHEDTKEIESLRKELSIRNARTRDERMTARQIRADVRATYSKLKAVASDMDEILADIDMMADKY